MNTEVVIQNVTYEIRRSFVSDQTVAQRLQEIITRREIPADSLKVQAVSQYNTARGDKNQLVADEVTAPVVQRIFARAAAWDGLRLYIIAMMGALRFAASRYYSP